MSVVLIRVVLYREHEEHMVQMSRVPMIGEEIQTDMIPHPVKVESVVHAGYDGTVKPLRGPRVSATVRAT